jgi:hypothetical protein
MSTPRRPRFDPDLSHAIDRLILAIEAARPAARKPLRVIKRALEAGVPARRGR